MPYGRVRYETLPIDIRSMPASASLHEAARLMTEHRVHRLVVVAERDGGPIGVISESDVVREVAALTEED